MAGYVICFAFSATLNMLSIIPALMLIRNNHGSSLEQDSSNSKLSVVVIKNRLLWGYVFSGFLIYLVFSKFESVYSLALETSYSNPAEVYSILLSLNSLFGILMQSLLMKKRLILQRLMTVNRGVLFFQAGYALYALAFLGLRSSLLIVILGVFVYSVGEVITIPQLDIQIDLYAPEELKSEFFSLAELRTLGFVIGPVLMSGLLNKTSASFSCIIGIGIFAIATLVNSLTTRRINTEKN